MMIFITKRIKKKNEDFLLKNDEQQMFTTKFSKNGQDNNSNAVIAKHGRITRKKKNCNSL